VGKRTGLQAGCGGTWLSVLACLQGSLPCQPAISVQFHQYGVPHDTHLTGSKQSVYCLIHSRMPQGEHKPGECAGRCWGNMLEGLRSMHGTQGIKLCSLCKHRPYNSRSKVCLCLKSCSLTAAASACSTVPQQAASCNAHEHWACSPGDSTTALCCYMTYSCLPFANFKTGIVPATLQRLLPVS
jgi:hypothetical protein